VIKLKIEATDGADLRKQLQALLGTTANTSFVHDVLKGSMLLTERDPVMQEVRDADAAAAADKPAPTRTPRKPKAEKEPEGNASVNEGTAASSDPATAQDDTSQTSDSGQTAETDVSPSDEVTIEDIRELTLKVVDKCGKPGIEAVLEQFGVARATQVPEERRPELRDALQDALDAAVVA